jgi:hypothetical protein
MDEVAALFSEGHVVQTAQAAVWAVAMVVALATARARPTSLDVAVAGWQGGLALLALARELDLHEALQAVTPIHFRLRWLLESDASLWWKGAVLGLGVVVGIVVLVPPLVLPVPWWSLVRRGDRVTWLFLVSVACLFGGYVLDDLVRRAARPYRLEAKALEETLELVGAVGFWAFVEAERTRPLTTRLQRQG